MGKTIEYPHASFKSANEMADAVYSLGGSCSTEMCAEKMGNKLGGGFNNILSAAQKFGLISYKAGNLSTTTLYKEIVLAYTEEDKKKLQIQSFLTPPVFSRLYERFKGKELPISLLDKMLIKEYAVDDNVASRIKKYFIDGVKITGLLDNRNHLISISTNNEEVAETEEIQIIPSDNQNTIENGAINTISLSDLDEFVFHITGPGINSKIAIREEDDFTLLEVMIRKIKKRFDFNN